jgi:hypothetical protein
VNRARGTRVLAATQHAIMAAEIGLPEAFAYTLVSAVRATGIPGWTRLIDAIGATIGRHDVFTWQLTLDTAYQVAASGGGSPQFGLEQKDLRAATPAEANSAVRARLAVERHRVISLLAGTTPYTRMIAFRMPVPSGQAEAAACVLTTHHVLADEHSIELLWNEIFSRAAGREPAGCYDLRYADWARSSVSHAAAAAARQAGAEIAGRIASAELGTFPQATQSARACGQARQIQAVIPASLTLATANRAAALAVPPTAVYAAAAAEALASRASSPNLTISVPVTCRKTTADLDVVGCYISAVPVLARAARRGETEQATVLRAHASLRFAADRAHADHATIRMATGNIPQAMLAFESPRRQRSARPVSWTVIPPPGSPAKAEVAIFISPGVRGHDGEARLLWQPSVLDTGSASELAAAFLGHARRLSAGP